MGQNIMKKGDTLTANSTLKIWNLTKGEKLLALSKEKFYNGEHHILTSKGWLPSVFFYEDITFDKEPTMDLHTVECLRDGKVIAKFEEKAPVMSPEEFKRWRLIKGIMEIRKQIGGLHGETIVYKINDEEVNF